MNYGVIRSRIGGAETSPVSCEAAFPVNLVIASVPDWAWSQQPASHPDGGFYVSKRPPNFDYQAYLASREWALLKEQVRDRSDGWCELCHAAPYQETHHVTYERIGNEDVDDLAGVCSPCHRWLSGKSNEKPLARAHLVSERLTRDEERVPLHLVFQTLSAENYQVHLEGSFWVHCRPRKTLGGKCLFCISDMLTVEDFYRRIYP